MLRFLKTLLIWFMIAGLPLQGMAAAVKASCGPRHSSALQSGAVPAAHGDDIHAAHSNHHAGEAQQDKVNQSASAVALQDGSFALAHGVDGNAYCSACAVCCVGAFAPPSVNTLLSPNDISEGILLPPPRIGTGFVPGGLERPPKNLSL